MIGSKTDLFDLQCADDTNVTFSAASIHDHESQINSDLKYIDRWLKANKLSLNVAKTVFMVISSRQKLQSLNDYTMNIHIDSAPINQSNQSKSLGLIIDENLSWDGCMGWPYPTA